MKIPNKIKILGKTYEVEFQPNYERDEDRHGSHCPNDQKIVIDSSIHREAQESTFIHELLEAIKFQLDIKLEHTDLCALESTIYQIVKDNDIF